MSWTATVLALTPTGHGVEAVTVLSDGAAQKFQQSFQTDGTAADLQAQAIAVTVAKAGSIIKSDISIGQVLDLTPAMPPPPPPVDQAPFLADLDALRREVRALALGLTTGQDVTALRATVQADLGKHPEFAGML